ncbi:hypothetical protein A2160_04345 [Candidatus Beckwithbacteria bacterium RBG_13_42_9]|uniref:Glycosyltransferase 2-like domain-containing protein n=1 Tax=Candidatus Beckwithbacteria bacterium RBG_13_42_9 TaxID=1797457 RepID=A0A1F5E6N3_9BACT|nr:MAG: hypothetical protein A2160_04345 [Candidatus Beckwithbacteria bacterium RBG_13_42_9]
MKVQIGYDAHRLENIIFPGKIEVELVKICLVKDQRPFFSIIIPTLNEELFLPRLLEDLIKQSFRDFEVIVIDGQSTDRTIKEAKRFNSKLPLLKIFQSPKRGLACQRNFGGGKAAGKYLLFFDADGKVDPSFLKKLNKTLVKKPYGIFSAWMKPDSNKLVDNILVSIANLITLFTTLIKKPRFCGAFTGCSQQAFIGAKGFNETIVMNEDYDFSCRCAQLGFKCKFYLIPKSYFSFRRFRREGYLAPIAKYTWAGLLFTFKGTNYHFGLEYKMGGTNYKQNKQGWKK